MNLKNRLQDDLKAALKARDEVRKSTIRLLLSAISYAAMEHDGELDDGQILGVLRKQVEQRQESIAQFRQGGRLDAAAKEEAEQRIIEAYLPAQMARPDIEAEARTVIAELGASAMRDMGKVMPVLMDRLRGRADGKLVNQVVRELLS
jgi:hypothetical protein